MRQCFTVPQVKKQEQRNDLDISKKQEIALFLKQLDNDGVKKTFQEVTDLFSAKWETDIHEAAVWRIKKSTQVKWKVKCNQLIQARHVVYRLLAIFWSAKGLRGCQETGSLKGLSLFRNLS